MTVVRHQLSLRTLPVRAFDSRAQGFSPPLARQRSSCPPPSPNLVRTHPVIELPGSQSAPCLSHAATRPKGTKLELGRGAHLEIPSSDNHTAAASQSTGRIAKAASYGCISRGTSHGLSLFLEASPWLESLTILRLGSSRSPCLGSLTTG